MRISRKYRDRSSVEVCCHRARVCDVSCRADALRNRALDQALRYGPPRP